MLFGVVGVFCDATFCIVYALLTTDTISRISNLSALAWGFLITIPSFVAMQECQRTENEVCDKIVAMTLGLTWTINKEIFTGLSSVLHELWSKGA